MKSFIPWIGGKSLLTKKITAEFPDSFGRLQTLPDNYTAGVSDRQRYRQLGNGWTVDVVAHILGGIK